MVIVCAWCTLVIGTKSPDEDDTETHTICERCRGRYFGTRHVRQVVADYLRAAQSHSLVGGGSLVIPPSQSSDDNGVPGRSA
jgi:hypothetical protein